MSEFSKTEKGKAFEVFNESIHNEITRLNYNHSLYEFFIFTKCKTLDQITKLPTKNIQEKLKAWIIKLKATGIKSSSIKTKLAGIELFLDMSEVVYHKRVIRKLIEPDKNGNDEQPSYTTEEIKRMLESTNKLRSKAIIHFLASTGVRPGSITDPVLRIKHSENISNGCKAIKVYDESDEGYWSFLTPEASQALDDYINSRSLNGEKINDESPIFANLPDANRKDNEYLSIASLYQILSSIMKQAGIVRIKSGRRYDKPLTYGFRKRFNKILKLNNEVNSNIAEKLMAHRNGLDGTYLKPTRDECFKEFSKAILDLTIDPTERLKAEKETLQKELSEKEKLNLDLKNQRKEIDELKERYDSVAFGERHFAKLVVELMANPKKLQKMIKEYGLTKTNPQYQKMFQAWQKEKEAKKE